MSSGGDFQQYVRMFQPDGWVGGFYSNVPFTVTSYMAAENLEVGTFVFNKNQGQNFGARLDPRQVGYAATATPTVGVVMRPGNIGVLVPPAPHFEVSNNEVLVGLNVLVMSQGEILLYIPQVAAGTATVGMQIVVPDVTNGKPIAQAAGGSAPAGGILTPFHIVEIFDGATPGLCGCSTWRQG